MNITELASQFYNFALSVPINNRLKRKSKKYFRTLALVRSEFSTQKVNHSCVNELESLLAAFDRNVLHMKLYGHDAEYRKSITENTFEIEKSIYSTIDRCYEVLETYQKVNRRHSF